MSILPRLALLKRFLGPEVSALLLKSIAPGAMWFLVELGFVFVIQAFLGAIGLVPKELLGLPEWWPKGLWKTILILISYACLRSMVQYIRVYTSTLASQSFVYQQRTRILRFSLFQSDRISASESMAIFGEMTAASASLVQGLTLLLNLLVASIFLSIAACYIAPGEFILSLTLLSLVFLPLARINRTIGTIGNQLAAESKINHSVLLSGIRNNFILAAYNVQNLEFERGNDSLRNVKNYYKSFARISAAKDCVPLFAGICVISSVSLISVKFLGTKPSALLSFLYLFMRVAQSFAEVHTVSSQLHLLWPSFQHLYNWHQRLEIALVKDPRNLTPKAMTDSHFLNYGDGLTVEGRSVEFEYEAGKPVFISVSFTANKGAPLLIKGPSGTGKSTLLKLVLGLSTPSSGSVTVNGQNAWGIRSVLGHQVGYVGPDSFLIPGTIRTNLFYPYNPINAHDDEIWRILEICKLTTLVRSLEGGLDHYLNEVTPLSTGQKQRLAMAAALLRKPSLLVLDEATANLDPTTEFEFIRDLEPTLNSLTAIIVTHKDSFDRLPNARTLVLSNDALLS